MTTTRTKNDPDTIRPGKGFRNIAHRQERQRWRLEAYRQMGGFYTEDDES